MLNTKVTKHPSLLFASDLEKICEPLQEIGVRYFSNVRIDANNNFSALGLQPEFVKLYFSKKYYNFDLHMAKNKLPEQYIIWDNIERVKESKELYDDFQDFGLGHTFSIILDRDGYKDCYHFSATLGHSEINQCYLNHLDLLKRFINYFTDKINAHKELAKAYDIKFATDTRNGNYFTLNNSSLIDAKSFKNHTVTERVYLQPGLYLTKREWECLNWLAQSKTLHQTATLLSITERTVRAHINNIKEKFSCDNLFQLGVLFEKTSQIKMMEKSHEDD